MISASLSLSLPRLGWKSTSMPRSLKICTAAGDNASEMRTLGLDMGVFLHPPLEGEGRREAPEWGESRCEILCAPGWESSTPPRRTFRCVDPPPPGVAEETPATPPRRGASG